MKSPIRFLFVFLLLTSQFVNAADPKKILIVVSSYGKDGEKIRPGQSRPGQSRPGQSRPGQSRPGYEFDEFSQAYLIFKANGFALDVASPRGGRVEADEFNKAKPYNQRVLADQEAMTLLNQTRSTHSVNVADYAALYIVGGKGAMFDLPFDPALQDIIGAMYDRADGIVSAVCHGPAALVHVKQADGTYLIAGKTIAGFCNDEEQLFGKRWKTEFPFSLEDKLKQRGGRYERAELMLPHVSVDGRLITGQNPYSTNGVAEAVVQALGKPLAARVAYPDEKSMWLVKRAITGQFIWAADELRTHKADYDIELIAVYGYYRLLGAKDDTLVIRPALQVIDLASPYLFDPNLQVQRAVGHRKLGEMPTARALLNELLRRDPNHAEARRLLNEWGQ